MLRDGETVLVVAPQPSFADLVDLAFNQLRQYGRGDLAVSIRILHALALAASACPMPADRERLRYHAELLRSGLSQVFLPADRARFEAAFAALEGVASAPGAT